MTHRKQSLAGVTLAGAIAIASLYGLLLSKSNSHAQQATKAPVANSKPAVPEEIPSGPGAALPIKANKAELFLGVAGCTAAACHGGQAIAGVTPDWRSAYTHWFVNSDPHEAAYAVLKTDRSKRIVWLLDQGHPSQADDPAAKPWLSATPHLDNRCLTCHSIQPDAQTTLSATLLMDGVSCEACHGPAHDWKGAHTTVGWASNKNRFQEITTDPTSTAASTKMWNTKDPVSRAAICARCHVGGPDRDVNHDLIAAGHPRLNFEYAAFMQNYAQHNAHWNDTLDRQAKIAVPDSKVKKPADHETRLWFIGQWTSMQAGLNLLQQRVNLALKNTESNPPAIDAASKIRLGHQRPAWPELSEFDCYACHHDLNADSWRRDPKYRDEMLERYSRKPGTISWGTWLFNDANQELFSTPENRLKWHGSDKLNVAMEKLYQSRKEEIPPKIKELGDQFNTKELIAKHDYKKSSTAADIRAYRNRILDLKEPTSWDEAVQRYLALVAFNNSLEVMQEPGAKAFSGELEKLREMLIFEENQDGPKLRTMCDWSNMLEQFESLKKFPTTKNNNQ